MKVIELKHLDTLLDIYYELDVKTSFRSFVESVKQEGEYLWFEMIK